MAEFCMEEVIDGLKEKLMGIVAEYKGDFTEVEIMKQIMCEGEMLLATYNCRELFQSNLDICEAAVCDEETEEVLPDMKKLAEGVDVVSLETISDAEFCHTMATINFRINDKLTWTVKTLYDRTIEEAEDEDEKEMEDMEDMEDMDDMDVNTRIRYALFAGHSDGEMKPIVDFEFLHKGAFPDDDDCCCEGDDCCGGHCHHDEEDEDEEPLDDIVKLEFDMDIMDLFTQESGVSISSEDFLCYLVSMEFWEDCWDINGKLAMIIDDVRNPDENAYVINAA